MENISFFSNKSKISFNSEFKRIIFESIFHFLFIVVLYLGVWRQDLFFKDDLFFYRIFTAPLILLQIIFLSSKLVQFFDFLKDKYSGKTIFIKGVVINKIDLDSRSSIFRYKILLEKQKMSFYIDKNNFDSINIGDEISFEYFKNTRIVYKK